MIRHIHQFWTHFSQRSPAIKYSIKCTIIHIHLKVEPHLRTHRIAVDQQIHEFIKSRRTRKVNDGLIITVCNMVTGGFNHIDF